MRSRRDVVKALSASPMIAAWCLGASASFAAAEKTIKLIVSAAGNGTGDNIGLTRDELSHVNRKINETVDLTIADLRNLKGVRARLARPDEPSTGEMLIDLDMSVPLGGSGLASHSFFPPMLSSAIARHERSGKRSEWNCMAMPLGLKAWPANKIHRPVAYLHCPPLLIQWRPNTPPPPQPPHPADLILDSLESNRKYSRIWDASPIDAQSRRYRPPRVFLSTADARERLSGETRLLRASVSLDSNMPWIWSSAFAGWMSQLMVAVRFGVSSLLFDGEKVEPIFENNKLMAQLAPAATLEETLLAPDRIAAIADRYKDNDPLAGIDGDPQASSLRAFIRDGVSARIFR